MAKLRHKITPERMAELQALAKLLPGLQMVDNKGKPVYKVSFKDIKYDDLEPADKKKYAYKREGPFKRIVKEPRYVDHLPELISIYKKEGSLGVENYTAWCNEITSKSNAAAAEVRPLNSVKADLSAAIDEVMIAKVDAMIEAANG